MATEPALRAMKQLTIVCGLTFPMEQLAEVVDVYANLPDLIAALQMLLKDHGAPVFHCHCGLCEHGRKALADAGVTDNAK